MNNKELYEKTVSILVKAYQNDTLKHTNPCGCAVGNLIAANLGFKVEKNQYGEMVWYGGKSMWFEPVCDINCGASSIRIAETAMYQIKSTGYTLAEVVSIENAFEGAKYQQTDKDPTGFYGLMNVVDVLDQIHKNTDPIVTKSTKEKFTKLVEQNL